MFFAAQVPADGWNHMSGWGWSWMALAWLFWISIIALVVWGVSRSTTRGHDHRSSAEALLAERFARGEITAEQYKEQRDILRG